MPHDRYTPSRLLRPAFGVALAAFTLAGLGACGGDDQGGTSADTASVSGGPARGMPAAGSEASGTMMELRQVRKELSSISQRAMEDSALRRRLEDIRAMIDEAMREMSPRAGEQMERMDSIRSQAQAAQTEGDTARLRSLMMEAQKLQRSLKKLRSKAMQQEDVAAALEEFQSALREKMRQIDPGADSLMERADSLQKEMQRQTREMMGGQAPSDTAGG